MNFKHKFFNSRLHILFCTKNDMKWLARDSLFSFWMSLPAQNFQPLVFVFIKFFNKWVFILYCYSFAFFLHFGIRNYFKSESPKCYFTRCVFSYSRGLNVICAYFFVIFTFFSAFFRSSQPSCQRNFDFIFKEIKFFLFTQVCRLLNAHS